MKVLFLDDSEWRHNLFREWCSQKNIVAQHVRTADNAAAAMEEEKWDICFLDHDLSDEHYGKGVGELPGDGTGLAKWMSQNPSHIPPKVIVHSWNPDGAKRMVELIWGPYEYHSLDNRSVVWCPFGLSLIQFLT